MNHTVAVYGLGVAGEATARACRSHGLDVILGDDSPGEHHHAIAREFAAPIASIHDDTEGERFLNGVSLVVPAPGVPPHHPLLVCARRLGIRIVSELALAYEWEQQREGGARPLLAVTGTDGKTTTTMLAATMLRAGGVSTAEVGNTDLPFVAALDDPVDAFVIECSSFRLEHPGDFRADVSAWLNIAPDHLDWHGSFDSYVRSKARLWSNARASDTAVVPNFDEVVRRSVEGFAGRVVTFGVSDADYRLDGDVLVTPHGVIGEVGGIWRSLPHDVTNSLAAAALVLEAALVGVDDVAQALVEFVPAPHRVQHVGSFDGVDWYDDSKATSPHAALSAIRSFDHVVLIAGGRNKDLDLTPLASEPRRMVAVVAMGEAADLIERAFDGVCPVERASSMADAVARAHRLSHTGNAVLLSPGCTSFDAYRNYGERGDDFRRCVMARFTAGVDNETNGRVRA